MTKENVEEIKVTQEELGYEVKVDADNETAKIIINPDKTLTGIVMSDLHLSPRYENENGEVVKSSLDDNFRTDDELAARFQKALDAGKAIFLAGDIVEGWQRDLKFFTEDLKNFIEEYRSDDYQIIQEFSNEESKTLVDLYLAHHKNIEKKIEEDVRKTFPKTFSLIDKHKNSRIFYIKGNHDSNIGILNSVTITNNNYLGRISHGHEHDDANSGSAVLGKFVASILGVVAEAFIDKESDEWFNSITSSRTGDTTKHIKKANIQLAKDKGFNFIVTGHTHKGLLEIVDIPGKNKKFANVNSDHGIYYKNCNGETQFTVSPNGIVIQNQQYDHAKNNIQITEQARCFLNGPWVANNTIGKKIESYKGKTIIQSAEKRITHVFNLFRNKKKTRRKTTTNSAASQNALQLV